MSARKKKAVDKIYSLKERDRGKPLILLGYHFSVLQAYIKIPYPPLLDVLATTYWPGALTVIVKKNLIQVPGYLTSNFDSVGIRVPHHKTLLKILKEATPSGVLASTSANISNHGDKSTLMDLEPSILKNTDYLVQDDLNICTGTSSTIVKVYEDSTYEILRQGTVVIDL